MKVIVLCLEPFLVQNFHKPKLLEIVMFSVKITTKNNPNEDSIQRAKEIVDCTKSLIQEILKADWSKTNIDVNWVEAGEVDVMSEKVRIEITTDVSGWLKASDINVRTLSQGLIAMMPELWKNTTIWVIPASHVLV